MKESKKKYFNLTVFCDGSYPGFIVDEDTMASFQESFDKNEETISFTNKNNDGDVVLRNGKLVGYQKSSVDEEAGKVLNSLEQEKIKDL